MRSVAVALTVLLVLNALAARAEDASEFEAKGIAALKLSQTDADAVVSAAIHFGKAADAYEQAKDALKATEMNSFLYWCKKKMTLQQMDAFLKGGDAINAAVAKRMKELETAPKVDEAQAYFDRAEAYAKAHPNEHLLIAIRFFEVAGRFIGSELSLQAQDRSLKEIMLDKAAAPKAAAKESPVAEPAPAGKKAAMPSAAQQKETEKTIKDVYKEEFAKPTPQDKVALAAKLEKQAEESADDAAARFELLTQAGKLSAQAGDVARLSTIFEKLISGFDFDFKDFMKAQLSVAASKSPDAKLSAVAVAMRVLIDRPDDPASNLAMGKYRLSQNDMERAALFFDKSKNVPLIAIMKRERDTPLDANVQLAAGDAWWDLSDGTTDKEDKWLFRSRAAFWYERTLPSLTGLVKLKIEKRVAEFPKLASAIHGRIDVLKAVIPTRDAIRGDWKLVNDALECVTSVESSLYEIPTKPGIDYDLHIVFIPTSKDADLNVILPTSSQPVALAINGWGNTWAGLQILDGGWADKNETTVANQLKLGVQYDLAVQVRQKSIRAVLNKRELVNYHFKDAKFSLDKSWKTRDSQTLGLYVYLGTFRFKAIELTDPGH